MSFETEHFIDGTPIRPVNADNIGFNINWVSSPHEAELTVDNLILSNNAKSLVEDFWDSSGPFQGVPYSTAVNGFSLEYYIDFEEVQWFDSTVEVKIKRRKALDQFMQDANGLSFELLNTRLPNGIQNMINIPYVIIKDNQVELLIALSIATYNLTKALIEGIRDVQEALAEVAETLPPVPGNAGAIIAAAIRAAARIVYVIALIVALINIVNQILNILFPPIRYFKASYFNELLRQGCEELGYQFDSELFYQQFGRITYLPVPLQPQNQSIFLQLLGLQQQSYTKGYPTANDSTPSLGVFIDALLSWFNAKIRVNNNVVRIERRDWWQNQAQVTIDNQLSVQDRREQSWTYNFDEWWKRYFMHYQTDFSDIHTLDNLTGVSCEYSTEPINVVNADLVNIKGLVEISIPFALGSRKSSLTFVENTALVLAQVADSLINTFGGNSNLAALIQGRIGVLQISSQYFNVSKVLWALPNGRQPANYLDKIGANAIYQANHTINQVAENMKRIYESPIPFSPQKFINLLDNNYVFDQNQEELELLDFNWINENREANIQYAIPSDEAINIQTIKIDG